MRRGVSLVFWLLWMLSAQAQNQQKVDSLARMLQENISAEKQADLLIQMALEFSGLDSAKSAQFLSQGLAIADSIQYEKGQANGTYVLGRNAMMRGDYLESEIQINALINTSQRIDFEKGIADGLYGLGWISYYKGEYDKSIEYHLQALEIRRKEEASESIADSFRGLGITYKLRGEFEQALYYLSQALNLDQTINNAGGMAEALNHIGIISSLRGNPDVALEYYYRALKLQEAIRDKSGLAYTYQNIGLIHEQQAEYDKTLEYLQKSLELRREIGEVRGIARITYNLGEVYHKMGNYSRALAQYTEAMEIKKEMGDQRGIADGLLNIGNLYADQGDFEQAVTFQEQSLAISSQTQSDWGKINALVALGSSNNQLRNFDQARVHLIEALELAKAAKLAEQVKESASLLAMVEMQIGHYKDAYEAQLLYQQISDSLSNEQLTKRMTLLAAKFQFQQEKDSIQFANERERAVLDQRIKANRQTQMVAFLALIILLMIIIVLIRYYRLSAKSARRLYYLNEEKNNLIGIVAHDLKNPLSAIMGAISLFDDKDLQPTQLKLKAIIETTSQRMMSMVTDILNVESLEKDLETMELEPYDLSAAVIQTSSNAEPMAKEKHIQLSSSVEPSVIIKADGRFVIQIIDNLLSNALKFSPINSQVSISLTIRDHHALLEVKDHGPGISEGDQKKLFQKFQRLAAKPTGEESSTGLGLSIVRTFMKRMGGRVWCESQLGQGASFFVELPLV